MKKSFQIYFIVFSFFFTGVAQSQNNDLDADSLRNVFHTTDSDSLKLRIAFGFVKDYEVTDPDSAFSLARYAKTIAENQQDTLMMARIYDYLGGLSTYTGKNYEALRYELDALKMYQAIGENTGIAKTLNNIGESYFELDLFNDAYDYYNKSLNKFILENDTLGQAVSLYNVGRVLKAMGQLEKARSFIEESMQISTKINDTIGIPYSLNDLGEIYILEGKYNKALEVLNEAYQICTEKSDMIEIFILTPQILSRMAQAHRAKGQYAQAIEYHDMALRYYEKHEDEGNKADIYYGKGRTYHQQGDFEKAERWFNEGLYMAKNNNEKGVTLKIYEALSLLYENRRDYQKSLEFHKKYKAIGDSLYSERKSEQFSQLQLQYETQKKDIEIALLNQREKQQQDQLKNEEFLRNILVVILAFTAVLLVTLYRSGARRKKINELLVVHQKEIESQSRELEKLLEMKDKFFSIVSHDLRSPINALVGLLDMLDDGHLTQEELIQVTRSLKLRLDNTRKLLDNLLDWAMLQMNEIEIKEEEIRLRDLVEDNLAFFREINDKSINFFNKVEKQMVVADRNMLDLIIRNLVSNSIKFTEESGFVEIFVEENENNKNEWIVAIADDGIGMTPDQVDKVFDTSHLYTTRGTSNEKGTGLGLKLCKEFVERMGGKIWVESQEEKGSTFKFTIKKS